MLFDFDETKLLQTKHFKNIKILSCKKTRMNCIFKQKFNLLKLP